MAGTRYYEDVTGFFRDLEVPIDNATARAFEAREREEVETVLDAAVGRGAIASSERRAWRERYRKEPQLIAEILQTLPGRPAQAERAFTEDSRIRSLDEQFAAYLGIERTEGARSYGEDDERNWLDPTGILHLSPGA